jgi:hypothetical protein
MTISVPLVFSTAAVTASGVFVSSIPNCANSWRIPWIIISGYGILFLPLWFMNLYFSFKYSMFEAIRQVRYGLPKIVAAATSDSAVGDGGSV